MGVLCDLMHLRDLERHPFERSANRRPVSFRHRDEGTILEHEARMKSCVSTTRGPVFQTTTDEEIRAESGCMKGFMLEKVDLNLRPRKRVQHRR